MRSMRHRLAAVTLLGGLTTLGLGLSAGPASAALVTDCNGYVGGGPNGSLNLTSTPAAGSSVPAGSDINLHSTWTKADFDETDHHVVCGTVGGVYSAAISGSEKSNNDGSYDKTITLPANLPIGSDVCVLQAIEGKLADLTQGSETSQTICFKSAAAVVATTTTTEAPTTTTTVAPRAVEPTVDPSTSGAGGSSPIAEPAPVVAGEVAVAPAPLAVLPRTGSGIDTLAGFGGIALALGGLTRILGRRRSVEG